MSNLKVILVVTLSLATAISETAFAQEFRTTGTGIWSSRSRRLWPDNVVFYDVFYDTTFGYCLASPSKKYVLKISNKDGLPEVSIIDTIRHKEIGLLDGFNLPLTEILWSQDEKSFAVTRSDGGWVGTWSVTVAIISDDAGVELINDIEKYTMPDFRTRILPQECSDEFPNMAAVDWVGGSRQLLMVGEIPPHSSCKAMGEFEAYIVDIESRQILKSLDSKEFLKSWKNSLGVRLIK